ncbi:863e6d57-c2f2-4887-aaf1-49a29f509a03 [Thermothielavioides terrestris]|uniref:863e6d57-c2f2-4887-aaf1-49a29f509a03 n=1 Tax=Thermothielavioides terrestris TaxID=2587410 RepID=A0A3S4BGL4_9PEZI|nr:863e6d57-c2f2-4887-aaf1-49a29f509a03 [Thermothielavioides terrestris]
MTTLPTVNAGRILAKPMRGRVHIHYDNDDDCVVFIRCNGREFHIELSPLFLCNSPLITSQYRKFTAAIRGRIFAKVAPDAPPAFDPDLIRAGEAKPLLSDYLFPEIHRCRLESEDDKPFPIHMPDEESQFSEPLCHIPPDLAKELEKYVKFFDPSTVEVSFRRPKQALDDQPTRVLVDLDGSGEKTTCFVKGFGAGEFIPLENELEAHLRLLKSNVAPEARVVRLLGVVAAEDDGRVAGLLLTYVDCRSENDVILDGIYLRRTPIPLRERWVSQIKEAVRLLHEGGIVWGGAKADNVLIDKKNDAWLIGLGYGYTEGWVDNEKAGTKEGDLQGVERIVEYLFCEGYESASSEDEVDFDSASE